MENNANTIDFDKKVKSRLACKKWREKIKQQEEINPELKMLNRKKKTVQQREWRYSIGDEYNKQIQEKRITLKETNPELLKLKNKKQVDYNNKYRKTRKNLQMFLSILLVLSTNFKE